MNTPDVSSSTTARQDLEDSWRLRLEDAREQYERASVRYRRLLEGRPEGVIPPQDGPLMLARHAESEALMEYTRILKIFTELTVHGQIPQGQSAMYAGGERK